MAKRKSITMSDAMKNAGVAVLDEIRDSSPPDVFLVAEVYKAMEDARMAELASSPGKDGTPGEK